MLSTAGKLLFSFYIISLLGIFHYGNIVESAETGRVLQSGKRKSRSGRAEDQQSRGKEKVRRNRLEKLLPRLIAGALPAEFTPAQWSTPHRPSNGYAILAVAMSVTCMPRDVKNFAGTLRKNGYTGDIVLAIEPGTFPSVIETLIAFKTTVYNVNASCEGEFENTRKCSIYNLKEKYPICVIRYYLYLWWARQYDQTTYFMISDFRDVIFQSDPFQYRKFEWAPPAYHLVVFQENHPNSVINRCEFNKYWLSACYGSDALQKIGHNTVICSGISMGTRDAILVYSHLMTQQIIPSVRKMSEESQGSCVVHGMDQGFHNWLVYSGELQRYFDVMIYQQGEGPVNTVGSLYGGAKRVRLSLEEWGILKGKIPNAEILNWNGDPSPAVHQLDRYLSTYSFNDSFSNTLKAVQGLYE